jgi:hypothetical protein
MWSCPCGMARVGACVTAWCVYWLYVSGWSPMLANITRGDGDGVVWVLLAIFGFGGLWLGIREARRHHDMFNGESFLWSVAVLALGMFALRGGWYLDDSAFDWHLSRAFWFGWMASNAVNIWLQLRGMRGREVPVGPEAGTIRISLSRRWMQRTTEWSERFEADRNNPLPSHELPRRDVSPVIEHDAPPLPKIVYVKEGDAFVPVRLPAPAVPVEHQESAVPREHER